MSFQLIADDRERGVIEHLLNTDDVTVRRLTVGDYAITSDDDGVVMIVERKSLSDLAASIKDGRMSNHDKLLDAKAKCGCQLLYVIEGDTFVPMEKKFNGLPYKCLLGKLDRLMLSSDIGIIYTRDEKHTAVRLCGLLKTTKDMMLKGKFRRGGAEDSVKPNEVSEIIQCKPTRQPDHVHALMLSKLPKVSKATAKAILTRYTIRHVLMCEFDAATLSNIQYAETAYRIGQRADDIVDVCAHLDQNPLLCAKILSCVDGVTEQCAASIIRDIRFRDIVTGEFDDDVMRCIPRNEGGKIKVGKAITSKIRSTFQAE